MAPTSGSIATCLNASLTRSTTMPSHATVGNAIEAIEAGAYRCVNVPFDLDDVALAVGTALESSHTPGFDVIVGQSPAMQAVKSLLARVAASPASTVLLVGETGTGKDLAAKALHYNSHRAHRPFVHITCSAIPELLLESELFGHERGAFTDARQQKRGLFETAAEGTVFLDEIGEMSPALQAKLLRVLEDKTFKRVGGLSDVCVDVRVVAATHRNLEQLLNEGKFREDLFYRLQVMPIVLPPLRERLDDVPLLASYFVRRFNRELRRHVNGIAPAAVTRLQQHSWPGNVRELKNAIERAMLLIDGDTLEPEHLTMLVRTVPAARVQLPPEGVKIRELERDLLVQALERSGWNQTRAAQLLGLNRDQIRYRMEKFRIRRPDGPVALRAPARRSSGTPAAWPGQCSSGSILAAK